MAGRKRLMDDDDDSYGVGKGRPPIASQFKPGQSGNWKGRPKGKKPKRPEDVVLDQMVTVRENGLERVLRADQAFLLHLASQGLAMGGATARAAMEALANRPSKGTEQKTRKIVFTLYPEAGDVGRATRSLQITTLLDPERPTAYLRLETWIVEAALARLGERQLTQSEQEVVVAATRMPHKVRWPAWWTAGLV
jgi:hypothetical protein